MRRIGFGLLGLLALAATATTPPAHAGSMQWSVSRISIDAAGVSGGSESGEFTGASAEVGSWARDRMETVFQVIPPASDGSLPDDTRPLTGAVAFTVHFTDPAQPDATDLPTITLAVTYNGLARLDAEGRLTAEVAGTATSVHVDRSLPDESALSALIDTAATADQLAAFTSGTNLPPELLDAFLHPGRYHIAGSLIDDLGNDLALTLHLDGPSTVVVPAPVPVPEPSSVAAWTLAVSAFGGLWARMRLQRRTVA
jgi:hypothetical protein